MRFDFSPEQLAFGDSLRRTLERLPQSTDKMVAGTAKEAMPRFGQLTATLAELGVFGVLVPEAAGGIGLGLVDALLVAIECGRVQLPFPTVEAVVAAGVVANAHTDQAEALAAGEVLATCATGGALKRDAARGTIGGLLRVPYAAESRWIVAALAEAGGKVCILDAQAPGIVMRPMASLDLTYRLDEVEVAVDAASVTIASDDIECQLATLHCGELLGIAEACLERTQRYLKERTQFGDVIGRNQSLKHIAADDLMRTESMRLATEYAAWAHEAWRDNELSRGEFELAIDVMRVLAPSSGRKVVEDAIQLHGGVGFTWELGLHLPLRRALRLGASLGAIHDNRERIAGRMFGDNATAAISPIGAAAE